jgi:hypothetical protein
MANEIRPDQLMIGNRVQVRGVGKYAHAVAPLLSPVKNFSSGNPAKQAEHDQVHQGAAWSLISRKPFQVFARIGTFSKWLTSKVAPAS